MRMSKYFKTTCSVFLSVCVIISTLVITYAEEEAPAAPTEFRAEFSALTDGAVAENDTDTVDYLKSKFLFYAFQHYTDTADKNGQYFERPNVNGYLQGDDGNIFPDTGAHTLYDMDGCGSLADKGVPTWTVDGKWLYCTAYSKSDAQLFRQANLMYLRGDTPSEFAVLEDFYLQTDFMFNPLSDDIAAGTDNLAIIFRASQAGYVPIATQAMLSFDADGNLYLRQMEWHNTPQYTGKLKRRGTNNDLKLERGKQYHLSVMVLGNRLYMDIFDSESGEYNDSTKISSYAVDNIPRTEGGVGGYLAFTGSNAGVKYADINVARLADDGSRLDFDDYSGGRGFGMNAQTYGCYRYKYVCKEALADGGNGIWWNQWYFRLKNETYQFDYTKRGGDEMCAIFNNPGALAASENLGKMFSVYYDQLTSRGRQFVKAPEFYSHHGMSGMTEGCFSTWMSFSPARLTTFMDPPNDDSKGLLKRTTSLVAKTSDENEAVLENFETEFSVILFENKMEAFSLSFRSQSAGQMSNDAATGGYNDKVTVYFSGTGFQVYDGTSSPNTVISDYRYKYNGSKIFRGETAKVHVKVVGDKMTVRVTDNSDNVCYDNSSSPIKISTGGGGFLYYSAAGTRALINSITCDRLDKNGNIVDWDSFADTEIKKVLTVYDDIKVDHTAGQKLSLPEKAAVCLDTDGNKYPVKLKWQNDDYRSYKEGEFIFKGVPENSAFRFAEGVAASVKVIVKNTVNGSYNADTTIKYYFDHENDFKDFVCHITEIDYAGKKGEVYPVKMKKVNAADYWQSVGGWAVSNHERSVKAPAWNGLSRVSDVSTMVLADADKALVNYRLEIEFKHGNDWLFPYILYGVQEPSRFFGDLYVSASVGDINTGANSDLRFSDDTYKGGVYSYLENNGAFNFWGAIDGDVYERVIYDRDITDGQDFINHYNSGVAHKVIITVVNGAITMQAQEGNKLSDKYYADMKDAALGGFVGFGAYGNGAAFTNLSLTALDEFGNEVSFNTAEKGMSPEPEPDTYKGWQPTDKQSEFVWGSEYIH